MSLSDLINKIKIPARNTAIGLTALGASMLPFLATKANAEINGIVYDDFKNPIPYAYIMGITAGNDSQWVQTNENGEYTHPLDLDGGKVMVFTHNGEFCGYVQTEMENGQWDFPLMRLNDGIFDINSQDEWDKWVAGNKFDYYPNSCIQDAEANESPIPVFLDDEGQPTEYQWTPEKIAGLESHIGSLGSGYDPSAHPESIENMRQLNIYERSTVKPDGWTLKGIVVKLGGGNQTQVYAQKDPITGATAVLAIIDLSDVTGSNRPFIHSEFARVANDLGNVDYESCFRNITPISSMTERDASKLNRIRRAKALYRQLTETSGRRMGSYNNQVFEINTQVSTEEKSWGAIKSMYK